MKGKTFTFGSFIRKNSFLNCTPFLDLTPASRKVFCIVYALFVFSLFQNVLCENINDLSNISNENYQHPEPNVVVRNRRSEQEILFQNFSVSEHEPVADKLIAKPTRSHNNHRIGSQEDEQVKAQAPKWTRPDLMERQVYAKPLNQIVSQTMF